MPGCMLRHNQTGYPVMGEIGPRRTAVFICMWFGVRLVDIILHKHIMYSQRHAYPMKTVLLVFDGKQLEACHE